MFEAGRKMLPTVASPNRGGGGANGLGTVGPSGFGVEVLGAAPNFGPTGVKLDLATALATLPRYGVGCRGRLGLSGTVVNSGVSRLGERSARGVRERGKTSSEAT